MVLILRTLRLNDQPVSKPLEARFEDNGGSIGRAEHNTLALPEAVFAAFPRSAAKRKTTSKPCLANLAFLHSRTMHMPWFRCPLSPWQASVAVVGAVGGTGITTADASVGGGRGWHRSDRCDFRGGRVDGFGRREQFSR